jgi:hypothetical protein
VNVNDFGVIFRFDTNFNMSAFTGLKLTFFKPDGVTTMVRDETTGVALGLADANTDLGTFLAFQYVTYTFLVGEVDQAGDWTVYLTYDQAPTIELTSSSWTFTVGNPTC